MGILSLFKEAFSDLSKYQKAEMERKLSRCIGACKQDGNIIYVYDTDGNYVSNINGLLVGYTQQSVTVRDSGNTLVYDIYGNYIRSL